MLGIATNQEDGQKQPSKGILRKRCSENIRKIYRRTPMPKCDFNKVAQNFTEITLRHGCSPVNLLHILRTPFTKNTSGWLLLDGYSIGSILDIAHFESNKYFTYFRFFIFHIFQIEVLTKKVQQNLKLEIFDIFPPWFTMI